MTHCWKGLAEWCQETHGEESTAYWDALHGEPMTCILEHGHAGPHEWTPDANIRISFPPAMNTMNDLDRLRIARLGVMRRYCDMVDHYQRWQVDEHARAGCKPGRVFIERAEAATKRVPESLARQALQSFAAEALREDAWNQDDPWVFEMQEEVRRRWPWAVKP